jgi:hypothetical protein
VTPNQEPEKPNHKIVIRFDETRDQREVNYQSQENVRDFLPFFWSHFFSNNKKKNLNDKIGLCHFIYFDTAKAKLFYRE